MPGRSFLRRMNPLEGLAPADQYRELHWDNDPSQVEHVDVPGMRRRQAVVQLGRLKEMLLCKGGACVVLDFAPTMPPLVVGAADNRLYIAAWKGLFDRGLRELDRARVLRVIYDADKGGERAWWDHPHEKPHPRVRWVSRPFGALQFVGGGYRVAREGIVG